MVDGASVPGQVTFWTETTTVSGISGFTWDDILKRLKGPVSDVPSETKPAFQVQSDSAASHFNEGNQFGQGVNPRVLGVADGGAAVPVNAPGVPTLVVQRVD